MKKSLIIFLFALLLASVGCSNGQEQTGDKGFEDLFKSVEVTEIPGNPFALVGENFAILTSGTPEKYNSMVSSWGGWGIQFGKPAMFHMLRSNRYTLELMRQNGKYTVSFFDDSNKQDITLFGRTSGRDSDKMSETKLTPLQTPGGSMSFAEAIIIFECTLQGVTTVSPDDFPDESNKEFIVGAFEETGDYHKLVFGEITNVWVRR